MSNGSIMDFDSGAKVVPLPQKQSDRAAAVLRLVRVRVDERIEFLIDGLKANIADALFEEMDGMEEQQALSRHFNIMRAMKIEEAAYRQAFDELMGQTWVNFADRMDEDHIDQPFGAVADLMHGYSKRVSNHYKVLIQEVRFRFQTLLQREVGRHPLHPDLYYRAFWQSLRATQLTHEEKLLTVPLFHRFVMDRYGQILSVANRSLVEMKVDTTFQLSTSSQ